MKKLIIFIIFIMLIGCYYVDEAKEEPPITIKYSVTGLNIWPYVTINYINEYGDPISVNPSSPNWEINFISEFEYDAYWINIIVDTVSCPDPPSTWGPFHLNINFKNKSVVNSISTPGVSQFHIIYYTF